MTNTAFNSARLIDIHALIENTITDRDADEIMLEMIMSNDRDAIQRTFSLSTEEIQEWYCAFECCPIHECDWESCEDEWESRDAECKHLRS